jgi:predicted transcriptional regulator
MRGGAFTVSLNGEEYAMLEKLADETGLTKSRIMKTALMHFSNTQAVKELKKVKMREEVKSDDKI